MSQPKPTVVTAQPVVQGTPQLVVGQPLFVSQPHTTQNGPPPFVVVDGMDGYYTEINYCGPLTFLFFFCFFWIGGFLIVLCPIDRKLVFVRRDGVICLPV
jgi:hypothetical protein